MTNQTAIENTEILRLWCHVFGNERGLLQLWTGYRGGDGDIDRQTIAAQHFNYPKAADSAAAWALAKSEEGREVYFCVHLLTRSRRKKENAALIRSLWGELDGAEVPNGDLKPTGIVESSPGHYHVFWRLGSTISPESAEKLNKRIAKKIDADPSGFDLTQLLRVPGTTNHKYDDRPLVRVLELDGARELSPHDLDELLPKPEERPRGRGGEVDPPVALGAVGLAVWSGIRPKYKEGSPGEIDKSATLLKIGRVLYDAGATRAVVTAALAERDVALGYRKFADRPDAEQRYDEIFDELESNGQSRARVKVPRDQEAPENDKSGQKVELTDVGNVERFVAQHGRRVRWCPSLKSYLVWDGKRWARDDCEEVVKLAQDTARSIHREAATADDTDAQKRISRWAVASQSASRINAMLQQARPHIAIRMESLDADPWLFNCQSGTVDLRTGELQDHDPADLITKLAPVDYDPSGAVAAPRFEQFLKETLVKGDVIAFVQRFAGYSLTGDTRERALAILWGGGKNGKSTLVELLRYVMGDYAQNTDVETVLAKKHQGVGNEVAALKGARFVSCAEVEKGRRLAESKVKQLTGSDTVTARYLFAEPFDFKPQFKLWMSTNNKPEIRGTDDAIWDRIRLIPFTQRFEGSKRDAELPKKLREESEGVLAWLVAGCLAWQRDGLGEPEEVTSATAEYRSEMDSLATFIDECCVIHKDASVTMARLYSRYSEWCEKSNETAETKRSFGRLLTERGFHADRGTGNAPIRTGIGLLTNHEPPPDGDGGRRSEGNSSDEQVTTSEVTKSGEETDNTNARVTTVTDSYHRVTLGDSENPCKSPENVIELPSVTQKSTTYPMKNPREETFRKQGNYGNYGNFNEIEPTAEAALKALGKPHLQAAIWSWRNAPEDEIRQRFYALVEAVAKEAGDEENRDAWFMPVVIAAEELGEVG